MLPRKSGESTLACPIPTEAHRALELLEEYHADLTKASDAELKRNIEKLISHFKSNLFNALCGERDMIDQTAVRNTRLLR